jgi:hypothetical protein
MKGLCETIIKSGHKKTIEILDRGACARLTYFPDGAGKIRYIGIGN